MKQFHGLEHWSSLHDGPLETVSLASWLLDDLRSCDFSIYGQRAEDDRVLLARLPLLADSLSYDPFDHRIDFVVSGPILRNDCVPLTYRLQGRHFAMTGRCSMISKVCGVDLYLQSTYSGQVGDIARHKFALPLKSLLKSLKDS